MTGVMKVREGKDPVSLSGYEAICRWFYKMKPTGHRGRWSEALFVNLYLRLQCATIGRTDNVGSLLITHIEWQNDAITVTFSTTKSDKAGETTNERKHLYCSSSLPHLCVFLALALFVWCKHMDDTSEQGQIFKGSNQTNRFYLEVMQMYKNLDETIDLGAPRDNLGTHSIRKFADTYASNIPGGPLKDQVKHR